MIAPPITDMFGLVPERVDADITKDANRRLNEKHGRDFGDYLWEQSDWVSGGLMVGVEPNALQFRPFEGGNGSFGMLSFPLSLLNSIKVKLFDGQHRRFGSKYVFEREEARIGELRQRVLQSKANGDAPEVTAKIQAQLDEKLKRVEELSRESIPILIYEEGSLLALQQMFSDAAKARPPDAITVARFDQRNAFNVAAFRLSETHDLLVNRVEMERSTLSSRSNNLVTLNQLSNNILKVLFVKLGGRVGRRQAAELTAGAIADRGRDFLDDLLTAREELQDIVAGDIETLELRERNSMLVNATMQKILASIWQDLTDRQGVSRDKVVDFIASLPMEPSADGIWVDAGLVQPLGQEGDDTPLARAQEVRRAVTHAVAKCLAQ